MKITIKKATPADMPKVLELIQELAAFEREPNAVEITVDDLIRDGFGANPAFTCFVAHYNNTIAGMALVYPRYSTWKGKTIHLEDLIVNKLYRGKGIGNALLSKVIHYGYQQGVKRIEWAVLDWNTAAIKFYESKGAVVLSDWDIVQMNEQAIKNFVNTNNENI